MRAIKAEFHKEGRSKENKWSEYSDPKMHNRNKTKFPSGVMRNKMSHSTAVHTDNRKMSACSAHHALGSTSEVRIPCCSRALTRLRNTKTNESGQKRHSHPTESNTAEPQPTTDNTLLLLVYHVLRRHWSLVSLHPTKSKDHPEEP